MANTPSNIVVPPAQSHDRHLREIGGNAVWSLSSCKQGFGVQQLRDGLTSTYWQSDGPQPHAINVQFLKKTAVKELAIYAEYRQDESYTPSKISIRVGSNFHDLREIKEVELNEPEGWVTIPLRGPETGAHLRTFVVQIAILANHQNGRDTHVRLVSIFAPEASSYSPLTNFKSDEFAAFSTIR
eukprot:m.49268 g.49268  ORF g.49268 m.49268 type:complete len:184 (+) comp10606_c0_seq1:15-566(+)